MASDARPPDYDSDNDDDDGDDYVNDDDDDGDDYGDCDSDTDGGDDYDSDNDDDGGDDCDTADDDYGCGGAYDYDTDDDDDDDDGDATAADADGSRCAASQVAGWSRPPHAPPPVAPLGWARSRACPTMTRCSLGATCGRPSCRGTVGPRPGCHCT